MIDQKEKFSQPGLETEFVGEAQHDPHAISRRHGSALYINPESLLINSEWREMLQSDIYRENLVAFVVDKALCQKMVKI